MPSGNKPLPEPMLTHISVAIWNHLVTMSVKAVSVTDIANVTTSFTVLSYVKASSFLGISIFVYICPNFVSLYERRHIGDIICEFLASGLKDTA